MGQGCGNADLEVLPWQTSSLKRRSLARGGGLRPARSVTRAPRASWPGPPVSAQRWSPVPQLLRPRSCPRSRGDGSTSGGPRAPGPCRVSPASRRVPAHSPRVSVAPSSRGKVSRGISAFVKRPRGKRLEVETLCLLREPAGRTWSGVSFAMSAPWGRSSRMPGPEHARGTRKWLVSFSKAAKSIRRPRLCLHPPETQSSSARGSCYNFFLIFPHLTRYLVISFLLFH